ncbi:MAG: AN1-type zinc finger domain-containing protein [Conexivisphaerales archaeon]
MECNYCGKEEPFPFKCSYCGEYFCADHRLPENHACKMYAIARPPRDNVHGHWNYTVNPTFKPGRISKNEALSFLIGAILVWLVGYSVIYGLISPYSGNVFAFYLNSVLFVAAFLIHEYAHKLAANLSGLWAEFKLNFFGLILTLISIISPVFKVIAPGATVIFGITDVKTMGKIALWGPLTNIIMSLIILPIILFDEQGYLIIPSFYISSLISLFNLIPLSILDGQKVFAWNKIVWLVCFCYSLLAFLISLYLVGVI